MNENTAHILSPTLVNPAWMEDLIVQQAALYEKSTTARRALAQSFAWVAGCVMQVRQPVGRVLDCQRLAKLWKVGFKLAGEEVVSELKLDPELDVESFITALSTEYSRILCGPDTAKIEAVLDRVGEAREALVPRMDAVALYGARLLEDPERIVEHANWLGGAEERGMI